MIKKAIVGRFTGTCRPWLTHPVEATGRLGTRLRHYPAASILLAMGGRVSLTQGTAGLTTEIRRTGIRADSIDGRHLRWKVSRDRVTTWTIAGARIEANSTIGGSIDATRKVD